MLRLFMVLFVFINCGCVTLSVNPYSASAQNVSLLRKSENKKINVGKFEDILERKKISCRAVPIQAPGGETFAEYIQKALISDLMMADVYDANGTVTLTATLDKLELISTSGAYWDIEVTVKSSNGHSFKVTEIYKFESAFDADNACRNAVQAFAPAVQNLIFKIVNHSDFKQLLL